MLGYHRAVATNKCTNHTSWEKDYITVCIYVSMQYTKNDMKLLVYCFYKKSVYALSIPSAVGITIYEARVSSSKLCDASLLVKRNIRGGTIYYINEQVKIDKVWDKAKEVLEESELEELTKQIKGDGSLL